MGRMVWTPKEVIQELDKLQTNFKLPNRAVAFDVMLHYSKIGQRLDFTAPVFGLPKRKK